MVRVIICGSRRREDVEAIVESGADGVGLITEVRQDLPCNLSRRAAAELCRAVPPLISSVLILTEEDPAKIKEITREVRPSILQLHGFNPPEVVSQVKRELGLKIVKVLHVEGERLLEGGDPIRCALRFLEAGADAILLDSFRSGKVGATGTPLSWDLARKIRDGIRPAPLILAGGLNEENVASAIKAVRPFAVDVLSGVVSGGWLDPEKVRRFVRKAREAGEG